MSIFQGLPKKKLTSEQISEIAIEVANHWIDSCLSGTRTQIIDQLSIIYMSCTIVLAQDAADRAYHDKAKLLDVTTDQGNKIYKTALAITDQIKNGEAEAINFDDCEKKAENKNN